MLMCQQSHASATRYINRSQAAERIAFTSLIISEVKLKLLPRSMDCCPLRVTAPSYIDSFFWAYIVGPTITQSDISKHEAFTSTTKTNDAGNQSDSSGLEATGMKHETSCALTIATSLWFNYAAPTYTLFVDFVPDSATQMSCLSKAVLDHPLRWSDRCQTRGRCHISEEYPSDAL